MSAMSSTAEQSPLAIGFNNTPEQRASIELEVTGTWPHWLRGSLYRGCPGIYDVGSYTSEHWFDGFSRVNRFEIVGGKVRYCNRNQADELMAFVEETGRYPGGAFAQDPCKLIFGAFETRFRNGEQVSKMPSAKNVGVDWIRNWPGLSNADRTDKTDGLESLVATTDANELMALDPVTLEPLKSFSYQSYHAALEDGGMSAAHPGHGSDGCLYNYVLVPGKNGPGSAEYRVFELDTSGTVRILATITDAPASYIHEVFGTENYVVLVVWQAYVDLEKIRESGTILGAMKQFDHESCTSFYVINKKQGGLVAKYSSGTFFAFHAIAAFEDTDGSIVIDLPWMSDWKLLEAARMQNLRAKVGRLDASATHDLAGTFTRYRLAEVETGPNETREALIDFQLPFDTCNIELPKLNEVYQRKDYRYAYGIHVTRPGMFADSVIKIDVKQRTSTIYRPDKDSICSEPIFVPRPSATMEDDGVLLSVVMDSSVKQSSLVVLDASNMREIARARLPFVMGYGFHGTYAKV